MNILNLHSKNYVGIFCWYFFWSSSLNTTILKNQIISFWIMYLILFENDFYHLNSQQLQHIIINATEINTNPSTKIKSASSNLFSLLFARLLLFNSSKDIPHNEPVNPGKHWQGSPSFVYIYWTKIKRFIIILLFWYL